MIGPPVNNLAVGRYESGSIYDRQKDIHDVALKQNKSPGNRNSGITVVDGEPYIFWNPYRRFYANKWLAKPKSFTYSGEGNVGDMRETGGNATLLNCEKNQAPVNMFYKVAPQESRWKYLGEYLVVSHRWGASPGSDGSWRRDLRFDFERADDAAVVPTDVPEIPLKPAPHPPSEDEAWEALQRNSLYDDVNRKKRDVASRQKRVSDPLKTQYVLARVKLFGGSCELCAEAPPWVDDAGEPHYQAHHIDPDIDQVDWIAGLCGTCHDRMHHGADRADLAPQLRKAILKRHENLGRPPHHPHSP